MKTILATIAAGMTAAGAFAAGYDKPYALVETGNASEVRKESPVAITRIDGESTRNPRKTDPIAPGKHIVTVSFSSARGVFSPDTIDVPIEMEACTRYRVVAAYERKTGGDWKPKLYPEPIGECKKKFAPKK